MDIGDLFRGHVFFETLISGIGFFIGGIVAMVMAIGNSPYAAIGGGVTFMLLGIGLIYFAYRIGVKQQGTPDVEPAKIGYSKDTKLKECPQCGEEKMEVAFDGSGICEACNYATDDYSKE